MNELKTLNDRLHKENVAKDRELRQLNKDLQQNEQTIVNLRNELCLAKCHRQDVSKKDVEVTTGCYAAECGDWEPVKDPSELLTCKEQIQRMEKELKCNNGDVISLRTTNVALHKELRMLRGVSAALASEVRDIKQRNDFKDEIIKELRIQLKRAKSQDVGTCTPGFRCSTPRQSVDRGQSMDITYLDKSTSISEILPCKTCPKPVLPKCKSVQALIPIRFITTNDIDKVLSKNSPRSSRTRLGRCGCASGIEPKLSCNSLTSKGVARSVSFYDDARESFGRSSDANSPSGSCASARAQYYHNKLLATIQILQNKEETVRIQAESLSVAEARITALTARTTELKREIDKKSREIQNLQATIDNTKIRRCDASIITDTHETDKQENIVKTLQNNLSVIEDLYRECFYETAKQEGIMEMLRKSYLDVRLVEREKSDQITRLNNVINTQKWSLDRCQDIASEVNNLKIEITDFLNNSNNDSGVWEESADGVMEDLQDINIQLLHLRGLLTGDCTCGLEQENKRLKQTNANLQKQVSDLRGKIDDLENILENKETADRHCEQQILEKEKELKSIRERLIVLERETKQCCDACGASTKKLQETEALLKEKCAELCQIQNKCKLYEEALKTVRNEVEKYEHCNKEICNLREENKQLQKTTRTLKTRLVDAQRHASSLEECCRQESIRAQELEGELCEAGARGAALCDAARRAVRTVRTWAALLRDQHRQQSELLQKRENQLRCLRHLLGQRGYDTNATGADSTCNTCTSALNVQERCNDTKIQSGSETEPHMLTSSSNRERYNSTKIESANELPCCSKYVTAHSYKSCVGQRQEYAEGTSASEMECSSVPAPRPLLKRIYCRICGQNDVCEAYVQRPVRSNATTCSCDLSSRDACDNATTRSACDDAMTRLCACDATTRSACESTTRQSVCDATRRSSKRCFCDKSHNVRYCTVSTVQQHSMSWSPCEEVFSRVEGAGAALSASLRRWRRLHPQPSPSPSPAPAPARPNRNNSG